MSNRSGGALRLPVRLPEQVGEQLDVSESELLPIELPRLARLLHFLQRLYWRLASPTTVGVRLMAIRDGEILLVKHTYLDGWYLPGGGVRSTETLCDAITREATEEAGVGLRDLQLFGVYSSFFEGKSDHIVVFLCEDFSWRQVGSKEIERVDCFSLSELPEGTSPGTRRRIAEYAAGEKAVATTW